MGLTLTARAATIGFQQHRWRALATQVRYDRNILMCFAMIEILIFSLKKDSRTRGHEVTLVKDQCRLDIRKYSQRTINEWDKLSTDCVTASSVNMFKPRLTHFSGGRVTRR